MFDLRQFAAVSPDWYLRLQYHEDLGSTNDEARQLAEAGAEHGTVVLAERQHAGRGRRGSSWVSEPGDGLMFSIILKPGFPKHHWSRIALSTGLGMITALNDKWNVQAKIKWPNDVYLRSRKCAGILAESREDFVVVGVGLNVFSSPGQAESTIPTIALGAVTVEPPSREQVLVAVLDGIMREVDSCDVGFGDQIRRLREYCYLSGKSVRFKSSGEELMGIVSGMADDGSLRVVVDGIEQSYAQASEIRVL